MIRGRWGEGVVEDERMTKLIKWIADKYFTLRLYNMSKKYTREVINGERQSDRHRFKAWRQYRCISLSGLNAPLLSRNRKMFKNLLTTTRSTSRHNRSIRWLCTEFPVMMLPLFIRCIRIINLPTSMFSKPWSLCTLDGILYVNCCGFCEKLQHCICSIICRSM